jgi:hypothetical protein
VLRSLLALSVVFALPFSVPAQAPKELRVGIIGCDNRVEKFTASLRDKHGLEVAKLAP